jgi:integrase
VENQQPFERLSTAVNVTVRSSAPRGYLTEREIERLMKAASDNRYGHRDATMVLIAYRHGLSRQIGQLWSGGWVILAVDAGLAVGRWVTARFPQQA